MARYESPCCGRAICSDEIAGRTDEDIVSRILCRMRELQRLDCHGPQCLILAGRLDIALDRAVELLRRGCPPLLAIEILR